MSENNNKVILVERKKKHEDNLEIGLGQKNITNLFKDI